MGIEIERKFLVKNDSWRGQDPCPLPICQGYLQKSPQGVIRVRLAGDRGTLTIKGATIHISRLEFEYEIPAADAQEMLDALCSGAFIEKLRHRIEFRGAEWVVDEFKGENLGLVVAEIELESIDQKFDRPSWLGREVSNDPRYFNAGLVSFPYADWKSEG